MNEFEKAERATEQAEKLSDYDFLMLYAKTMERRGKPGDAYLAARVASICSRLPASFRAAAPAAAEPKAVQK